MLGRVDAVIGHFPRAAPELCCEGDCSQTQQDSIEPGELYITVRTCGSNHVLVSSGARSWTVGELNSLSVYLFQYSTSVCLVLAIVPSSEFIQAHGLGPPSDCLFPLDDDGGPIHLHQFPRYSPPIIHQRHRVCPLISNLRNLKIDPISDPPDCG